MLAFPLVPPEVALTERRSWRPWDELAVLPPVVVLVEDWDWVLELFVLVLAPGCVAMRNPPARRTTTTTDRTATILAFNVLHPLTSGCAINPRLQNSGRQGFFTYVAAKYW
jgi:hypothetical protein